MKYSLGKLVMRTASCAIVFFAAGASAASFTSRAAYDTATGDQSVITFQGLSNDLILSDEFSDLGLTFTSGNDRVRINSILTSTDGAVVQNTSIPSVLEFGHDLTAFGIIFAGSTTFQAFDDETALTGVLVGDQAGTGNFFGFTAEQGETFNRVQLGRNTGTQFGAVLDDVTFDAAPATAVPVPAALPMFGLALAAFGLLFRRKG